jgi:hypothetical protein
VGVHCWAGGTRRSRRRGRSEPPSSRARRSRIAASHSIAAISRILRVTGGGRQTTRAESAELLAQSPELGAVPVTEPAIAGGHGTLAGPAVSATRRRPKRRLRVGARWCVRQWKRSVPPDADQCFCLPPPDATSNRGRPTCSGTGQWRAGRHGRGHPRPGSLTGPEHPKDQSISVRRLIDLRRGDRCRGAISSDFGREGPRLTSPSRTGDTPSAIDLVGRRWSTG